MREQVIGGAAPVLQVSLEPGESVVAEAGEFSWMSDSIQMSTGPGDGASFLFSTYTARGSAGLVAFAAKLPGSILPVDPGNGAGYMVHRRGFLAGTEDIEVSAGFRQSFAAGIFGGEGFILQRIGGQGRAWVELSGEVVSCELTAGQSLRAHPGHIGMFETSVAFQIMRVEGIANRYFGGGSHHFGVLSGPGKVWLQSMPLPVLGSSLAPHLGNAIEGGVIGHVLR